MRRATRSPSQGSHPLGKGEGRAGAQVREALQGRDSLSRSSRDRQETWHAESRGAENREACGRGHEPLEETLSRAKKGSPLMSGAKKSSSSRPTEGLPRGRAGQTISMSARSAASSTRWRPVPKTSGCTAPWTARSEDATRSAKSTTALATLNRYDIHTSPST